MSYNMSDFFNFMSFFFKWKIEVFISFHLKKQKPKNRMFSFQCDVFVFFFLNIHLYIESFWGDSILHNSGLFVARQQEVLHVTEDLSLLQLLQRFRPIVPAV